MIKKNSEHGQGFVEYALILVLVTVIVAAALSVIYGRMTDQKASETPTPAVMHPTIFTCYQNGEKLFEVRTDNGVTYKDINPKGHLLKGWEWTNDGLPHNQSDTDGVSCGEVPALD